MEGLTAQEAWAVLHHAEMPLRVEIFGFFEEEKQVEIIETIDRDEIAASSARCRRTTASTCWPRSSPRSSTG